MTFNSIEFIIFFLITYCLYWLLRGRMMVQNVLLLIASYIFYGWWDYRFLSLLIISSFTDYWIGLNIPKHYGTSKAKYLLYLSLLVNLGILITFKYYDFFVLSFQAAFASVGIHLNVTTLNIILPVGISFYTFQTLSYTIDIYRKQFEPTHNIINFFAYVSFFPQLVAGPIERAKSLLPQFERPRVFDRAMATDGLRQTLWGFFKKMVIADNVGIQVDYIFATYTGQDSVTLFFGLIIFVLQIYLDFSGYSDIAIGTGKLFGFRLMTNFRVPFIALHIRDFWSKWHISMTTWFRDYLYRPMVASVGHNRIYAFLSIMVLFVVIGLWHGANWTFVVYGFLNGLYFLPTALKRKNKRVRSILKYLYSTRFLTITMIVLTFILNGLTSVFFRAPDLSTAVGYMVHLFVRPTLAMPEAPVIEAWCYYIMPWMIFEIIQRDHEHQLEIEHYPRWLRFTIYYLLVFLILMFGNFGKPPFIYFQF